MGLPSDDELVTGMAPVPVRLGTGTTLPTLKAGAKRHKRSQRGSSKTEMPAFGTLEGDDRKALRKFLQGAIGSERWLATR